MNDGLDVCVFVYIYILYIFICLYLCMYVYVYVYVSIVYKFFYPHVWPSKSYLNLAGSGLKSKWIITFTCC